MSEDASQPPKPARRRRWLKITLGTVVLLLSLLGCVLLYMRAGDAEFVAFREGGVGINKCLKSFGQSLTDAVASQNVDDVLSYFAADYRVPKRGHWKFAEPKILNGISFEQLQKVDDADIDRAAVAEQWTAYVAGLAKVEHFEIKINLAEEIQTGKTARVTVKFIVDATDRAQRLVQDRFFFRWWLRVSSNGHGWEVVSEELLADSDVSNVRIAGAGNGFALMDLKAAGIDYVHRRDPNLDPARPGVSLKFQVIDHSSGGMAASDFDGDGWPDLFFCDGTQSRLYRNLGRNPDGGCKFEDVTQKTGLAGIDRATCALFADFNHDGHKDLFVGRYGSPCRVYMNNGDGTFKERGEEMGLALVQPVTAACLLDYDHDGFADIYIAVNGDAAREVPRIPFFSRNGLPNRLYRNLQGRAFQDVTEKAGVGDTGWGLAVCAGDIDGDGWTDLAVANDFGRKCLYRNNRDGTFTERAKEAGTLDFSGGMGICMGDIDGDGWADIYTSNIYSNQRWLGEEKALLQYTRNTIRSKWMFRDFGEFRDLYRMVDGDWRSVGRMAGEGNSLFLNQHDGTFRESRESCTNRAGWGWGVALFDANNDGRQDIYAANGWISTPGKPDF